jgi:mannitol-1-phosphate 5-dehydrogenase
MKAVIFGTGRIGCGFAGQLLHASGYEIVFVGRNQEMVDHLNRVGQYKVQLVQGSEIQEITVDGIKALWSGDRARVADAVACADLVATSVCPENLQSIAPLITAGLRRRKTPVNVLAFENLINAGPCLRRLVMKGAPKGSLLTRHGFSGALVSRVVTKRLGDPAGETPLVFLADPPTSFVVEGPSLCKPLPKIQGMVVTQNYEAWVLRKLYTFSAGHATAAYLGSLKGYHYIHTAIRDREIHESVIEAMREGQQGLHARYGPEVAGSEEDLQQIVARFENAALNDPIVRVGRDPRRKLGTGERLVGAARLAEEAGVCPEKLALATAAALCFCNPKDPSCNELQCSLRKSGVEATLSEICGLDSGKGIGRSVANWWGQLASGWKQGSLLLSLDRPMWA